MRDASLEVKEKEEVSCTGERKQNFGDSVRVVFLSPRAGGQPAVLFCLFFAEQEVRGGRRAQPLESPRSPPTLPREVMPHFPDSRMAARAANMGFRVYISCPLQLWVCAPRNRWLHDDPDDA